MVSACAMPSGFDNDTPTQKEENILQLARASESGQNLSQSVRLYQQAIEMSSGSVEAHMGLANLYDRKGKREEALQMMLNAKEIQPNNATINEQLATYHLSKADGATALNYANDGLEAHPKNSKLLNAKGLALDMQSEHDAAQAIYRQALVVPDGISPRVTHNLATSYFMTGEYDKAIAALYVIEPKGKTIRRDLALAYGLKGHAIQSEKWRGEDINKPSLDKSIEFYTDYLKKSQKQ